MASQVQISAKNVGQLALPSFCPRCFWFRLHCGDRFPFAIFPGIFSSIDAYSKKVTASHYAHHGRVPLWFDGFGELGTPTKAPHWSRFNITDPATNIMLTGVPDELLRRPDQSLFIGDYKCARYSATADELLPLYHVQMNGYAYIASRIGLGTVSGMGLLYYEPPFELLDTDSDVLIRKDSFLMKFTPKLLPIPVNTATIPPLLIKVRQYHDMVSPPAGQVGCKNCCLLDSLVAVAEGAKVRPELVPATAEVSAKSCVKSKGSNGMVHADQPTDLLCRILGSKPDIRIVRLDPDGGVIFGVSFKALGTTRRELVDTTIVASRFFADFIGEWLVRQNVFQFAELLVHMTAEEYRRKVLGYRHKKFGMQVFDHEVRFEFHLSLVQTILTEDATRALDP